MVDHFSSINALHLFFVPVVWWKCYVLTYAILNKVQFHHQTTGTKDKCIDGVCIKVIDHRICDRMDKISRNQPLLWSEPWSKWSRYKLNGMLTGEKSKHNPVTRMWYFLSCYRLYGELAMKPLPNYINSWWTNIVFVHGSQYKWWTNIVFVHSSQYNECIHFKGPFWNPNMVFLWHSSVDIGSGHLVTRVWWPGFSD